MAHVFLLAVAGLEGVRTGFEKDEMIDPALHLYCPRLLCTVGQTVHCTAGSNREGEGG